MKTFVALAAVLTAATSAVAQVKIDRLYPPVVGRGVSTIAAEGKFPQWPCKVVCDRDDVVLVPEPTSGQWQVTVAEDAGPGVAWIRFYDQRSASSLLPLLVETVTVTSEAKEPNDKLSEAPSVALPTVVGGRLAKNGDVDGVRVSIKSGETLVASLIANQILASPMDAVLQISDLDGNVLAQADDDRGLDPQLVFRSSQNQEVVVRVFAFPAAPNSTVGFSGAENYVYALRLTTLAFLDHVSPISTGAMTEAVAPAGWNLPADAVIQRRPATSISPALWYLDAAVGWHWQPSLQAQAGNVSEASDPNSFAQVVDLPFVFGGRITERGQVDRVRFPVHKGKKYTARSYAKSSGFLLDAVLRVIDVKTGKEIAQQDDISRSDFDAVVDFKAADDAEYELQVSDAVDAFGIRHAYAVLLEESLPQVSLSVAADQFTLAAGEALEIPVTITRTGGYAERISVAATALPEGITGAPVVSEPKGDTAKLVKLKLSAKSDVQFQGSLQILGTPIDAENKPTGDPHPATFDLPAGIKLASFWLSVATK